MPPLVGAPYSRQRSMRVRDHVLHAMPGAVTPPRGPAQPSFSHTARQISENGREEATCRQNNYSRRKNAGATHKHRRSAAAPPQMNKIAAPRLMRTILPMLLRRLQDTIVSGSGVPPKRCSLRHTIMRSEQPAPRRHMFHAPTEEADMPPPTREMMRCARKSRAGAAAAAKQEIC